MSDRRIGKDSGEFEPFAVQFEVAAFDESERAANTTTTSMSDCDTATYRRDTEDEDT